MSIAVYTFVNMELSISCMYGLMYCFLDFWDHQGVIYLRVKKKQGCTVTKESFVETLCHLPKAVKHKCIELLSSGLIILHHNVRAYRHIPSESLSLSSSVFKHPPYSPNLASSVYYLFLLLRTWLGIQRFTNDADLKTKVNA